MRKFSKKRFPVDTSSKCYSSLLRKLLRLKNILLVSQSLLKIPQTFMQNYQLTSYY